MFPGGAEARTNGNVANPGVDLKSHKWTAREFADAADGQLPIGAAVTEWSYGDADAGLEGAKLVLDESFVTAGLSHHSLEPRSALAYWQNGKCVLHASSQSQSFPVPGIARYLGIEPADLAFVAEFCGGGFGSKGGAYPIVAVPAYFAKKIGRPVMMRISRQEEFAIGSARAGFQGRIKIGFRADGRVTAIDLYIVQENGPNLGFTDWLSAADAVSLVYQPLAMRFRGVPVLTNTPPRGPAARPRAEPDRGRDRAADRQSRARARAGPRRDPQASTRPTTPRSSARCRAESRARICATRSSAAPSASAGRAGSRAAAGARARR